MLKNIASRYGAAYLSRSQHLAFFKLVFFFFQILLGLRTLSFSNSREHLVALRANLVFKYCLNKKKKNSVFPGHQQLAKEPEDSGYEIARYSD